jgi:hypothetical protein
MSNAVKVVFEIVAGPHRGRCFSFDDHGTFVVGRSRRAQFRTPKRDRYCSRFHFLVEYNPPLCQLLDLGSRNGTFLNREKVAVADLNDLDLIQVGNTAFRVKLAQAEPPAAVANVKPASSEAVGAALQAPTTRPPLPDEVPSAPVTLPGVIPGFEFERSLGRGGMGEVFLAVRQSDGARLGVKVIHPKLLGSDRHVQMFLREARILGELAHPRIVALREVGEAGERIYFAMDYIDGVDTEQLIRREGPLAIDRAVGLVCQALEGLAYAQLLRRRRARRLRRGCAGGRRRPALAENGFRRIGGRRPNVGIRWRFCHRRSSPAGSRLHEKSGRRRCLRPELSRVLLRSVRRLHGGRCR